MKYLLLIVLLTVAQDTHADTNLNLILPLYTYHIQHRENKDYTEGIHNPAIGLGLNTQNYELSSVYVHKNSRSEHSIYFGAMRKLKTSVKDFYWKAGAFTAIGGYKQKVNIGPIWGLQYKLISLVTTYPVAKLVDRQADVISLQLTIPLN